MCMSCCVVNTIMCYKYNCRCYVEVCCSEVGTIVECCIPLLIMVRSGTVIIVVALLYDLHHIMLKKTSHGFRSGDLWCPNWYHEHKSRVVCHIAYIKAM